MAIPANLILDAIMMLCLRGDPQGLLLVHLVDLKPAPLSLRLAGSLRVSRRTIQCKRWHLQRHVQGENNYIHPTRKNDVHSSRCKDFAAYASLSSPMVDCAVMCVCLSFSCTVRTMIQSHPFVNSVASHVFNRHVLGLPSLRSDSTIFVGHMLGTYVYANTNLR